MILEDIKAEWAFVYDSLEESTINNTLDTFRHKLR